MKPEPFRIAVEQAVLDDLQLRLSRARWPHSILDEAWAYGTSPAYLREFVDHWKSEFDWRKAEEALNRFAQFIVPVEGGRLHFVHQTAARPRPRPLLLLHGWPDSFYRYVKVIPRLVAPAEYGGDATDAFDVVVPSLPSFGFTGALRRTSNEHPTRQSAEILWRLMTHTLGYQRFAVAGGDGGSVIAQIMAIDHPESVIGIHLTDLGWHAGNVDPSHLSKAEQKYLESSKKKFMADGAYAMLQATKPHSLSPALSDSPVALASWILDRFHSWSDSEGDIEKSFSKDELLTNIMIYWVTNTVGPSVETYRADTMSPSITTANRVERPVGLALFPKDGAGIPPRSFAERTLNVQRYREMARGSHFAALEEPDLYAQDVIAFFRELETAR
jgi:pimeloyl-ACP methyl ester carboxylesterase